MQKKAIVDGCFAKVRCRVWDVTEKKPIREFESTKAAANFLGLEKGQVQYIMANKRVNRTNKLGKAITIRKIS
jgi:hypothetical protein